MSITTARDIIEKALLNIGVGAEGETISNNQAVDGLDVLNSMLSDWGARSLLTTAVIEDSHALTGGTGSYTIGSGATIDTVKPLAIVDAYILDQNNKYHLEIVSRDLYNRYWDSENPGSRSRPRALFYDPGATQQTTQTGTIYLYSVPDTQRTYVLHIFSEKNFTEFASINTAYSFPAYYKRAIISNLSIELAPGYGRQIPAEVAMIAKDSKDTVQTLNSQNKVKDVDLRLPGSKFHSNIYIDR